jgi:hypothetical protein
MDENQKSNASHNAGFASINALRLEHLNLMERDTALKDHGGEPEVADIRSFIARAKATGSVLSEKVDRREAQGILDYWSSTLVSIGGADLRTWSQPRLAGFEEAAKRGEKPADAERTRAELARLDDNARQLIRISALARQWRQGGKSVGYLLLGKALEDAKELKGLDKDVDELIVSSDAYVVAKNRSWRMGATALIGVLSVMVVGLGWSTYYLGKKNDALEKQTELVVKQTKQIIKQRDVIKGQNLQTNEIINELKKSSDRESRANNRSLQMDGNVVVVQPQVLDTTDKVPIDDGGDSPFLENAPIVTLRRNPANIQFHALPDVKSFDIGSDEARLSVALDINRRLRIQNNPTADQLALVKALVDLTSSDQMARLSVKGRHYLLFTLSLVPVQFWTKLEAQDVRSTLFQNLSNLQSAIDVKQIILEPKSQQYLDAVRSYVGAAK